RFLLPRLRQRAHRGDTSLREVRGEEREQVHPAQLDILRQTLGREFARCVDRGEFGKAAEAGPPLFAARGTSKESRQLTGMIGELDEPDAHSRIRETGLV